MKGLGSTPTLVVLGCGILLSSLTKLPAGVVGIDARHGSSSSAPENLATGSSFSQFRAAIAAAGHTIVNVSLFDPASLAGLDAIILTQATDPGPTEYSPAEIFSIQSFVGAGRGLLLIGEGGFGRDGTVANFNALSSPFGVTFGPAPINPSGFTISGFVPHPVTQGLSSIGMDYYRPLTTVLPPAVDLTLASGMSDVLAAVSGTGGAGNVVMISDASIWINSPGGSDRPITFGDNLRLLQNTLSFIAVPEPSTAALVMVAGVIALATKRRNNRNAGSRGVVSR